MPAGMKWVKPSAVRHAINSQALINRCVAQISSNPQSCQGVLDLRALNASQVRGVAGSLRVPSFLSRAAALSCGARGCVRRSVPHGEPGGPRTGHRPDTGRVGPSVLALRCRQLRLSAVSDVGYMVAVQCQCQCRQVGVPPIQMVSQQCSIIWIFRVPP